MQSYSNLNKLFYQYQQTDCKVYTKKQKPTISNTVLKNKFGGMMLPDLKTYYKAIVVENSVVLSKQKKVHQWNRIESGNRNIVN